MISVAPSRRHINSFVISSSAVEFPKALHWQMLKTPSVHNILMPSVNTWPPSNFLPSLPFLCSNFILPNANSIPRPAVSGVQITEVLKMWPRLSTASCNALRSFRKSVQFRRTACASSSGGKILSSCSCALNFSLVLEDQHTLL